MSLSHELTGSEISAASGGNEENVDKAEGGDRAGDASESLAQRDAGNLNNTGWRLYLRGPARSKHDNANLAVRGVLVVAARAAYVPCETLVHPYTVLVYEHLLQLRLDSCGLYVGGKSTLDHHDTQNVKQLIVARRPIDFSGRPQSRRPARTWIS